MKNLLLLVLFVFSLTACKYGDDLLEEEHPSYLVFKSKIKSLVTPYVTKASGEADFDILRMESIGTLERPAYIAEYVTSSGKQSNILLVKQVFADFVESKEEGSWTILLCELHQGSEKILISYKGEEMIVDFSHNEPSIIMENVKIPSLNFLK